MAWRVIYVLSSILVILFFSNSCSKRIYPENEKPQITFYPPPPDTARIQFLTRFSNSFDVTGGQNKFKAFIAGEEKPLPIIKPYGITIKNDKIYICDASTEGIEIIDLSKNSFEYFAPSAQGKLRLPFNCFVDDNRTLYVADVERQQVVIYNADLEFIGKIDGGNDFRPSDVIINRDKIYVTDPKNNRINVYDKNTRNILFSFPEETEVGSEYWLYNPQNIYYQGGKIYVTDLGDPKVKIFNTSGQYISSIGSLGNSLGQFTRPKGIAVDNDQNVFVVDAAFQNVQIFNNQGQLLMFFGGPYKKPGDMYLPAKVTIDYDHLEYFEKYVDPDFELKYLIFVTNQYGPDKVTVYGRIESKK